MRTPSRIKLQGWGKGKKKKTVPRHIIYKCRKSKKRKNSERSQTRKQLTCREIKMRIVFNLSETMQTRERSEIFKVSREKKKSPT